jgi:hypothetical protein
MSFFVPSAHIRIEGPLSVNSNEPTTFRLQGLIALLTAYSLRFPAGCFSNRQRSWDSPLRSFTAHQGSRRFRLNEPTYRFSCRCSHRRSYGPAQQAAVPGFRPDGGSVRRQAGLALPPQETPLGFALSGYSTKALTEPSPDLLSRASAAWFRKRPHWPGAPEYRSASASSAHAPRRIATDGQTTLLGSPHRPDPVHSSVQPTGLCVHLTPRRALLPTVRCSLVGCPTPYRSCQDSA